MIKKILWYGMVGLAIVVMLGLGSVLVDWISDRPRSYVVEDPQLAKLLDAEKLYEAVNTLNSYVTYGRELDTTIVSLKVTRDSLQPKFFKVLAQDASKKYNVNWRILYGIWMRESTLDPNAKGDGKKDSLGVFIKGSWRAFGLGQVHLGTARTHYDPKITKERLLDPVEGGYASAATFRDYLAIFKGNVKYAISAYQAGPDNVQYVIKKKLPLSNGDYVTDILMYAATVEE